MMGSLSIWHWLIFAGIAALLFGGKGKLSSIMGDAAKGIKAFKEGLKGEDHETGAPSAAVTGVLASDSAAVREAAAREAAAREVLARETALREAAERRAHQDAAR